MDPEAQGAANSKVCMQVVGSFHASVSLLPCHALEEAIYDIVMQQLMLGRGEPSYFYNSDSVLLGFAHALY
jgi:hypothetical protein